MVPSLAAAAKDWASGENTTEVAPLGSGNCPSSLPVAASQRRMVLSPARERRVLPSGAMASVVIGAREPLPRTNSLPVSTCQRRTEYWPPEATALPSGEKATSQDS